MTGSFSPAPWQGRRMLPLAWYLRSAAQQPLSLSPASWPYRHTRFPSSVSKTSRNTKPKAWTSNVSAVNSSAQISWLMVLLSCCAVVQIDFGTVPDISLLPTLMPARQRDCSLPLFALTGNFIRWRFAKRLSPGAYVRTLLSVYPAAIRHHMSAAITYLLHAFHGYRAGNRPEHTLKI